MYKKKRGIANRLFEQNAAYIIISICIFASFSLQVILLRKITTQMLRIFNDLR